MGAPIRSSRFSIPSSSDDDASAAAAPVASADAASPAVPDDATGTPANTAANPAATPVALTSDEAPSQESGDHADVGRAANVENLTYIGDGSFTGRGNSADNVIHGGAGHDTLWGEGGDDVLFGGDGNDALYGGSGSDTLFGGHGNDRFDGGTGDDVLYLASSSATGNSDDADGAQSDGFGNDTIVLRPGFGNDVVVGFDPNESHTEGHDRLDVTAYTSLTPELDRRRNPDHPERAPHGHNNKRRRLNHAA